MHSMTLFGAHNVQYIAIGVHHEQYTAIRVKPCTTLDSVSFIKVEPGCTPLSCYSAIIAFLIMTAGIFWLLLISPPKNSVPVPMPIASTGQQSFDVINSYEDDFVAAPSPTPEPIPVLKLPPGTTKALDSSVPGP